MLTDKSKRQDLDFELSEERFGSNPFGSSFGGYDDRHYRPGSRYGSTAGYGSYAGHSPHGRSDFADRVRRAAQQRQHANSRAGFYGYGWSGF